MFIWQISEWWYRALCKQAVKKTCYRRRTLYKWTERVKYGIPPPNPANPSQQCCTNLRLSWGGLKAAIASWKPIHLCYPVFLSAKLTCFLVSYASLLPKHLDTSGNCLIWAFATCPGGVGVGEGLGGWGGWRETEIKAHWAQLKLELGLSVGWAWQYHFCSSTLM